jgi:hypothetical protein
MKVGNKNIGSDGSKVSNLRRPYRCFYHSQVRNTEVLILVPARLLTDLRLVLEGRGADDECSRHSLHRMTYDTFLFFYCIDSLS